MTQHYVDENGNTYGSKPDGIKVTEVSVEEARAIVESKLKEPDNNRLRAIAYADPVSGSDRHFAEAARKSAVGDSEGADAATAAGLARVDEIKAEYPLP